MNGSVFFHCQLTLTTDYCSFPRAGYHVGCKIGAPKEKRIGGSAYRRFGERGISMNGSVFFH